MYDASDPYWDPNKGWNRASIGFWSRKGYQPKVTPADLLMPNGLGNLRMFSLCGAMALMITILYVWPVLFFLNFFVPLPGPVYGGVLGSMMLGFTLFLYFAGARETRRDRELAARL